MTASPRIFIALCAVLLIATRASATGNTCDRACLDGMVDSYLAALIAHDPSRLPLTPDAKFTENTVRMKPGEGVWKTATGIGSFKIHVDDPQAGQTVFIGVLKEGGKATMFVTRLKVESQRISEVETIIARSGLGGEWDLVPATLVAARPTFTQTLAASERSPRDKMIAIANSYYEGIERGTGDITPFADDCARFENGVLLTSNPSFHFALMSPSGKQPPNIAAMGCKAQFDTHFWATDFIDHRRFPVVDEERGLVTAFSTYEAHGTRECADVVGFGKVCPAGKVSPVTLDLAETFRITNGKIHEMESVWTVLPYRTQPGW